MHLILCTGKFIYGTKNELDSYNTRMLFALHKKELAIIGEVTY